MRVPKTVSHLFRVLIAAAIVAWLVSSAGTAQVLEQLTEVKALPVLLALLTMGFEVALRTQTWSLLLQATCPSRGVRYPHLLAAYVTSAMLGSFVPSSAGTDVIRAAMSHRMIGGHFLVHVACIVMQNALSFFAASLLGLAGLGLMWLKIGLPSELAPFVLPLCAIAAGVPLAYIVVGARRAQVLIALRRIGRNWFRLRRSVRRFLSSVLVFERSRTDLGRVLLVSTMALLLQSLAYALTAKAIGVVLPLGAWILLPSVIAIAGLLPASFLGFGATQAANVYVITACGVPLAQSVALATLIAVVSLVLRAVSGGLALVFWPSMRNPELQSREG
jgi:uncharacterized membrane protein YbhN (UPF0104 family)